MPTGDFHSSPDYRLSQYPGGDLYTHPHPGEYLVGSLLVLCEYPASTSTVYTVSSRVSTTVSCGNMDHHLHLGLP